MLIVNDIQLGVGAFKHCHVDRPILNDLLDGGLSPFGGFKHYLFGPRLSFRLDRRCTYHLKSGFVLVG